MVDIKQAVILAGGLGTRLRPLTDKIPKPLVPVNRKPFIEYLTGLLKENGITEIVLLVGYLHEKIEEHLGDGSKFGVRIKYSAGDASFETGTRIMNAAGLLNNHFLLLYCDNYWPMKLEILRDFYDKQGRLASVTVYANKDGVTRNNMLVDDSGQVTKYDKSRKDESLNGVDIGFYILNKEIFSMFPDSNFSFEEIILPQLIRDGQLSGFLTEQRYYSIGTFDKIKLTEKFLEPKKVVFLDRDGVINVRPPLGDYVKKWEEFKFLPKAIEAIRILNESGCRIYLITNQSGIARGLMSEDDLKNIHQNMMEELGRNGSSIDGIYYCPHGWENTCECRKPKPGMFYKAAREHFIDLTKAIFIGDDERDMQAGKSIDCRTLMVGKDTDLFEVVKSLKEKNLI